MSVAVLEPLPVTLPAQPEPVSEALTVPCCEFNSLGDVIDVEFDQCPNAAVWRTPLGSVWCETHKPTWVAPHELTRVDGALPTVDALGSELQRNGNVLATCQTNKPGTNIGRRVHNNPSWARGPAGGGKFL